MTDSIRISLCLIFGSFITVSCSNSSFKSLKQVSSTSSVLEVLETPQVSIESPVEGFSTKNQVEISGSCTKSLKILIHGDVLANTEVPCADEGTFKTMVTLSSSEGDKTVLVTQSNQHGKSATFSRIFKKDMTPPTLSLITPVANQAVNDSVVIQGMCEVGASVSLTENGSNYSVPCNNGTFATTLPLKSADGIVNIALSQTDKAGNRAESSVAINKDTKPPVLNISSPASGASVLASANIQGSCEGQLPVSISGQGISAPVIENCSNGSFNVTVVFTSGGGTKSLTATQTDLAGNSASVNRSFVRGSEPAPQITISSPAQNTLFKTSLAISGSCENGLNVILSGSGHSSPASTSCNNGNFSVTVNFTNGDGSKNIIASQTNAANVTGSASRSFVKDTTPPTLTIASPSNNSVHKESFSIMGACEDGITVQISGSGLTQGKNLTCGNGAYSTSLNLSPGDGSKSIQVRQADAVGNTSTVALTVVRDTTAPQLKITSPAENTEAETGLTIGGTCEGSQSVTVSGSGVMSNQSTACSNGSFTANITLSSGDGIKLVQVKQNDQIGNTATDSRSFKRVTPPPVVDGAILYAQNCASCHQNLDNSTKKNRTVAEISGAISSLGVMQSLSFLTTEQRQAIANVLKTDSGNGGADDFPYMPGKYLPVSQDLACDASKQGQTNNQTNRLTKKQIVNSLAALFGQTAVNQANVQSSLNLLHSDSPIGIVESFDNQIDYVEALLSVARAVTDYSFSNSSRIGSLLPNCNSSPTSTNCKNSFLNFAKQALRRPLDSAESTEHWNFVTSFGDTQEGLKYGVIRVLMNPRFHNHFELGELATSGNRLKVDPYEVASRLSFGITNSPPDTTLLSAADSNQLQTVAQLKSQAQRLINTSGAREHFKEFLISWLEAETKVDPHPIMQTALGINPSGLTGEMKQEFDQFIDHVVFDSNGTFNDLMTKRVMFPSTSRLAQLLETSQSSAAVTSPAHRGGLLLRPLVVKSGTINSAPISRGVRIRRQVLCTNLPSPDSTIINSRLNGLEEFPHSQYSNREVVTNITSAPACMTCHSQINPVGFAFESFGPFGEYRTVENARDDQTGAIIGTHNINTSVTLPLAGRQPAAINTVSDLAQEISQTPSAMRCFSQQIFRFNKIRNAAEEDGCQLNTASNTLINGGTIKDGIIDSVVNESIFWRGAN